MENHTRTGRRVTCEVRGPGLVRSHPDWSQGSVSLRSAAALSRLAWQRNWFFELLGCGEESIPNDSRVRIVIQLEQLKRRHVKHETCKSLQESRSALHSNPYSKRFNLTVNPPT